MLDPTNIINFKKIHAGLIFFVFLFLFFSVLSGHYRLFFTAGLENNIQYNIVFRKFPLFSDAKVKTPATRLS